MRKKVRSTISVRARRALRLVPTLKSRISSDPSPEYPFRKRVGSLAR
jgi:hypothetical protein